MSRETQPLMNIRKGDSLFGIWSEWDIGQEELLYTTPEAAKEGARELYEMAFDGSPDKEDFDDLWEDLLGLTYYTIEA